VRAVFREHEQRNGLAGANGAGDQAMAVTILGKQVDQPFSLADKYLVHVSLPKGLSQNKLTKALPHRSP